jgi:hypothetical protein
LVFVRTSFPIPAIALMSSATSINNAIKNNPPPPQVVVTGLMFGGLETKILPTMVSKALSRLVDKSINYNESQ